MMTGDCEGCGHWGRIDVPLGCDHVLCPTCATAAICPACARRTDDLDAARGFGAGCLLGLIVWLVGIWFVRAFLRGCW